MIKTITLNPSLDYIVDVDSFKEGMVNRSNHEEIFAGGKGINVSIVLKNLGIDNEALGYIAGFTGDEIAKRVSEFGVHCDFVKLQEGMSRINVKLRSSKESEINGQGPKITHEDILHLDQKLDSLNDGDILVLAGSIPTSLPSDTYENIMSRLQDRGIKFIVDATKDLLLNVLKYKPFLIKPNHHELGEIFNTKLTSKEEIISHGKKLQEMGAENVLISMAGDGAILITSTGEIYFSEAPKGTLKNSVGAGDSMVAGFIAGFIKTNNFKEAFKMSVATGSASAFSEGLATKDTVYQLLEQLNDI